MSHTLEPYKSYWAYQSYPCELIQTGVCKYSGIKEYKNKYPPEISLTLHTYLFDTQDEAYAFAEKNGAFDECYGKEQWCDTYDDILFEISENELEDYKPFLMPKEKLVCDLPR
jgi:hypothetical protein